MRSPYPRLCPRERVERGGGDFHDLPMTTSNIRRGKHSGTCRNVSYGFLIHPSLRPPCLAPSFHPSYRPPFRPSSSPLPPFLPFKLPYVLPPFHSPSRLSFFILSLYIASALLILPYIVFYCFFVSPESSL